MPVVPIAVSTSVGLSRILSSALTGTSSLAAPFGAARQSSPPTRGRGRKRLRRTASPALGMRARRCTRLAGRWWRRCSSPSPWCSGCRRGCATPSSAAAWWRPPTRPASDRRCWRRVPACPPRPSPRPRPGAGRCDRRRCCSAPRGRCSQSPRTSRRTRRSTSRRRRAPGRSCRTRWRRPVARCPTSARRRPGRPGCPPRRSSSARAIGMTANPIPKEIKRRGGCPLPCAGCHHDFLQASRCGGHVVAGGLRVVDWRRMTPHRPSIGCPYGERPANAVRPAPSHRASGSAGSPFR